MGINPLRGRYKGFVIDKTYLTDRESGDHQIHCADSRRRIYADEHIMCFGGLAYSRADKIIARQPSWSKFFAAKQWLKLV